MNAAAASTAVAERRRLLRATAVTTVVALSANLVIWAAAAAISDVPDRFTPLRPGSVAVLTIIGVAAAAGVFGLLLSRARNPTATFRRLVPAALAVSLIPDVLISRELAPARRRQRRSGNPAVPQRRGCWQRHTSETRPSNIDTLTTRHAKEA